MTRTSGSRSSPRERLPARRCYRIRRRTQTSQTDHREADRLLARTGVHAGPWAAVLGVTALALASAETALPAVLGRAVDAIVGAGAPGIWLTLCAALVAVLVVCDACDDLAVGRATARSTAWLRHTLVGHILAIGPRSAGRFGAGELAGRLVGNAADAGRAAPDAVRAVANMIPAAGGTVALALIDPWLCVTFLAGMPVLIFLVRTFARDASDIAARYLDLQGTIAARLVDALGGSRTIAAAGTADREAERILRPLPDLHIAGREMWRVHARISVQDIIVVSAIELAVLAVAGAELAAGRITTGQLLAAGQYVALAAGLGSAISAATRLTRSRAAAGRVAEVLAVPPVAYGAAALPDGPGRVELRGVTVRVDGRAVLEDVDLVLPARTLVAVVGRSGAGKSLLAALVGRLVDPDEGEVLLDGAPLTGVDRADLRAAVGYGFERPALCGETIGDAIAFGGRMADEDEVVEAARAARADEFIRRMPDGYDTPLAAAPMSGGETQRVGLARTFAHAGRVVILDDVAASLDTVTEHEISEVLTGALSDRTRIVVAHRASTAARAEVVVWLDEGAVRAVAPHEMLWNDAGYRALFAGEAA